MLSKGTVVLTKYIWFLPPRANHSTGKMDIEWFHSNRYECLPSLFTWGCFMGFHIWVYLILTTALWFRYFLFYSFFAWGNWVAFPKAAQLLSAELRFRPRFSGPRGHVLSPVTLSLFLAVLSLKIQVQWSSSEGEFRGATGVYSYGECYERVGEGLIKMGI